MLLPNSLTEALPMSYPAPVAMHELSMDLAEVHTYSVL